MKVRRRLQRLGAVALKNSVYLLPRQEDTVEDFEWLMREIQADGGEATLCQATLLGGLGDAQMEPCSAPSAMRRTPRSSG